MIVMMYSYMIWMARGTSGLRMRRPPGRREVAARRRCENLSSTSVRAIPLESGAPTPDTA